MYSCQIDVAWNASRNIFMSLFFRAHGLLVHRSKHCSIQHFTLYQSCFLAKNDSLRFLLCRYSWLSSFLLFINRFMKVSSDGMNGEIRWQCWQSPLTSQGTPTDLLSCLLSSHVCLGRLTDPSRDFQGLSPAV